MIPECTCYCKRSFKMKYMKNENIISVRLCIDCGGIK